MTLAANLDESIAVLVNNEETKPEEAFRVIDQEMNRHKAYMLALGTLRNNFALISRLPLEVLCSIFHLMIVGEDTRHPMKWIKVSHVCHAWRNAAVNNPCLWTKLPLYNSQWTEEMLSRSKMASLSVDIVYPRLTHGKTLSLALCHASRIRDLQISGAPRSLLLNLFHNWPNIKFTPRLESLRIAVEVQPDISTDCELPMEFLCIGNAPRLLTLEIAGCKINWNTHLVNSLTSLKIHDIVSRPTTEQFWNALKRMPCLEYLDLQNTFPVIEESRLPSLYHNHEPIFFKHLRRLTVKASTPQVEVFLKGISFLPMVIIRVICQATGTSGSDFTGALSAISSVISPSTQFGGLNIRTFHVKSAFSFRAYSNVESDFELPTASLEPNLDFLLIRVAYPSNTDDKILKDVFAAMPLGNLIKLIISGICQFSSQTLAETFGTLSHLQSVRTTNTCAESFVRALQKLQPAESLPLSHYPAVYFPNLRSVSMFDVIFEDESAVGMLRDAIMWRYECGAEVQELKFNILFCDGINHLRHIVVDGKWDHD